MSIKNYFTKKQNTYLKVLQLRYCGRDSIIQVRNRPYFHYGPFGRTKNKMEVVQQNGGGSQFDMSVVNTVFRFEVSILMYQAGGLKRSRL